MFGVLTGVLAYGGGAMVLLSGLIERILEKFSLGCFVILEEGGIVGLLKGYMRMSVWKVVN